MNYNEKFNEQLKQGNDGEQVIVDFLQRQFNMRFLNSNNTHDYDIKMIKEYTYEVKTDRYNKFKKETTNMFIETYCNGKPSGVSSSKADYFVYFFPDINELYLIKMDDLRKMLYDGSKAIYYSGAGDRNKVNGFLIDKNNTQIYGEDGFRLFNTLI